MLGVVSGNECQLLRSTDTGICFRVTIIDKEFLRLAMAGIIIFFLFTLWWMEPKGWERTVHTPLKFLFGDKYSSTWYRRRIKWCKYWLTPTNRSELTKALKAWLKCRLILSGWRSQNREWLIEGRTTTSQAWETESSVALLILNLAKMREWLLYLRLLESPLVVLVVVVFHG